MAIITVASKGEPSQVVHTSNKDEGNTISISINNGSHVLFTYLDEGGVSSLIRLLQKIIGRDTGTPLPTPPLSLAPTSQPPIGIIPKWLHDERRLKELMDAIERYFHDYRPIPQEWSDEYNTLIKEKREREDSKFKKTERY